MKSSYMGRSFPKNTPIKLVAELIQEEHRFKPFLYNEMVRAAIQRLCALAIPSKKKKQVVFSNDPWDLATMSMRGIKSCMSWYSLHSTQLVGSILDPACSIIYITDQAETEYGSKMLYRSLVRIIRGKKGAKNIVFIDRLYTTTGHIIGKDEKQKVLNIFRKAMEYAARNNPEFSEVMTITDRMNFDSYIPATPQIMNLSSRDRSCVDSYIPYYIAK
jgi:hypothetical protein